ncbi:hypothetical protein CCR75_008341 [Bremia lactucae]|uniref:SPARK domain-containing protein n=1 Tax=Bremia lactucae TaxID=4779 RepID=A0A976IEU3_BRELC|nr:hypothetical protein CCR75_008341 [Bremia lactucae]
MSLGIFSLSFLVTNGVVVKAGLLSACSPSLSDSNPPVLEPLRTVIGDDNANLFVGVLGNSVATSASTTVKSCAKAVGMLRLPQIQFALYNLSNSLNSEVTVETNSFLENLKAMSQGEMEHLCNLYVDAFAPCLTSQLLPSLATLRATTANGCCNAWESESVSNYGYTLTGQYAQMAQLLGDTLCAVQTPAFNGTSSQRCGYTLLQSSRGKATLSALRAATIVESLQVPSDQACLQAEGEAYRNIDGNMVQAVANNQFTLSGCVVALDRFATWVHDLPLAANKSKSFGIDLLSLFESNRCVTGSDVFPVIQDLLPNSIVDAVKTLISKACLHVPMKYADGCNFTRPVSLVDWNYNAPPVKQAKNHQGSKDKDTSAINKFQPVSTDATLNASVAIKTFAWHALVSPTITFVLSVALLLSTGNH